MPSAIKSRRAKRSPGGGETTGRDLGPGIHFHILPASVCAREWPLSGLRPARLGEDDEVLLGQEAMLGGDAQAGGLDVAEQASLLQLLVEVHD